MVRKSAVESLEQIKLDENKEIKDNIYLVLKKMIMTRQFTPNERLDAYVIATNLGVSRTPVRDALNMLDSEGFIQTIPRKGTFVTGIYREDLIELFQFRQLIELFMLEQGFPELVLSAGTMKAEIDQWDQNLTNGSYEGYDFMESDMKIHQWIVQSGKNKRIQREYDSLNCHVQTARGYYLQDMNRINASHEEHKALYNAIAANDLEQAKKALKNHLDNTLESLLKLIDIFKVF